MSSKNSKNYLFFIINQYLTNKIDARTFCNEYYQSYDLMINEHNLTFRETKEFEKLSTIANRFSEFQEDFEKYPGVYYSEAELKKAVLNTKKTLK